MTVDIEIEERRHLKWARLPIKSSGRKVSNQLVAVDIDNVFVICLWWEVSLWLSMSFQRGVAEIQRLGIIRKEVQVWLGECRRKKGDVLQMSCKKR